MTTNSKTPSSKTNSPNVSGWLALHSSRTQLTPLLALFGLILGIFAALVTPREEEPQIDVTMANVFVPFAGASPKEVASLVTTPMEQILDEIGDVEHITSISKPGLSVTTVQFKVGIPRTEALVRLYNAVHSNNDWRPANLNIGPVLVKPKGIDDVPVVALTLWTDDPSRGALELTQIAHGLETDLKRIPGTRDIDTIGAVQPTVRVLLSPEKLSAHGIAIAELRNALQLNNSVSHAGDLVNHNQAIPVQAGTFFSRPEDLGNLVVGLHDGRPVYLSAVATIEYGAPENTQYVSYARSSDKLTAPAVTVEVSKKAGENAVIIAQKVIERVELLKGVLIPDGVNVSISRNYGETANDKANKLIQKLIFASLSVIVLVALTMGIREAVVVGAAVVLTLAITLFASWSYGFTLNRVSLFALIFSIGILVDDAIVIVENVHRHLKLSGGKVLDIIPVAVGEVGGPTILATFTVIAALLPMAFVSGLMGPYMSPIPINASIGMFISLVIAFTFTPWLTNKLLADHTLPSDDNAQNSKTDKLTQSTHAFFNKLMTPFLGDDKRRNRYGLIGALILLIVLACSLAVFKLVVLKMLPFDNKSEFQIVVDLPEGSSLEKTNALLGELSTYLLSVEEVTDLQLYAGTASPIGFNGLVRQYYLRQASNLGDIQVNLQDKHIRERVSHDIARSVRPHLTEIAKAYQAEIKVVEPPPGPPVYAPLVAEVYGPDYAGQIEFSRQLREQFARTEDLVDVDDSIDAYQGKKPARYLVHVDRERAAHLGISQQQVSDALAVALSSEDVAYLHTEHAKYPIPIQLDFSVADKANIEDLLQIEVRNQSGDLIPLSTFTTAQLTTWQQTIYHKDLLPVVYVTGDVAGTLDSPLYGMFDIVSELGDSIEQYYIQQPDTPFAYSIKWDGEWQITYETFRDMGAAYAVGLLLIYMLVVSQFHSYVVPLVIMAPIPLTLIGIMPGHALLGAQFTATSMIGMIALAGILVRNSILLVDFINHSVMSGMNLEAAIINAASVRAKPIVLTAIAAMLGAFFILDDPIFNGLAVSLIFGILVSTVLTLLVIPLLYYALLRRKGLQVEDSISAS
ncbi:efflux RND transporter permease subunit [Thalassotalea piscium]